MKTSNLCSETPMIVPNLHILGEPLPSPARPSRPRRLWGSVLTFAGFMLSPLSWWNDLFVNVPLAIGFAWLVSLVYPPAFKVAVVVGYALTNVFGFVLMHLGIGDIVGKRPQRRLSRDLGIALLYTVVVLVLVHLGILQPLEACLVAK